MIEKELSTKLQENVVNSNYATAESDFTYYTNADSISGTYAEATNDMIKDFYTAQKEINTPPYVVVDPAGPEQPTEDEKPKEETDSKPN